LIFKELILLRFGAHAFLDNDYIILDLVQVVVEFLSSRRVLQFSEGFGFYLPDSFPRDFKFSPHFF